MRHVGIKEFRQNMRNLIKQVSQGAKFTITRRGRPVALLIAPPSPRKPLPKMGEFRQRIGRIGTPAAQLLREERSAFRSANFTGRDRVRALTPTKVQAVEHARDSRSKRRKSTR